MGRSRGKIPHSTLRNKVFEGHFADNGITIQYFRSCPISPQATNIKILLLLLPQYKTISSPHLKNHGGRRQSSRLHPRPRSTQTTMRTYLHVPEIGQPHLQASGRCPWSKPTILRWWMSRQTRYLSYSLSSRTWIVTRTNCTRKVISWNWMIRILVGYVLFTLSSATNIVYRWQNKRR